MSVTEWELTRAPDQVCWLIMRVTSCRVHYFTHDPSQWTRDLSIAWAFHTRQEAWDNKCALGAAFLLIHGGKS